AVLRLAQAIEISGPGDTLAIDLLDHIAALEAQVTGIGAVIHVDDNHAFISVAHLQLIDERRRKIGDLDPGKWRARPDYDLFAWQVWRGLQRDSHRLLASRPHDAKARGATKRLGREAVIESVRVLDVLTIDRHDEIPGLERSARRRAVRRDIRDQRTGRTFEAHAVGDIGRDCLQLGTKPGPRHRLAAGLGRSHHHLYHVRRDREADALRATGARENSSVDADKLAGHIDQRTTGIAWIDRSVCLDEKLIVADSDLRARQRGNDAMGHRLSDPERVANRKHKVTNLQCIGISEVEDRKTFVAILDPED